MVHLNYQIVEKRERYIHFIMFCVINGEVDINSPGIKEFLKGKDHPVSYMRGLSPESLNQLHMNVFSKLKKFKIDPNGKMLIRSDLLDVVSFKIKPEYDRSLGGIDRVITRVEKLINSVYDKRIGRVDISEFILNPNNVILPRLELITGLVRPVNGKWSVNFVLKVDVFDEIWK